jgi:ankyrin repeat protein
MATSEQIREFVIAGHGDLAKVRAMLAADPGLLNVAYAWSDSDHETAIQAAAHVGSVPVAEFLLAQGAPLALPTAAMLGRRAEVDGLLAEDPARIDEAGAHGIPLLAHAAFSGDAGLVADLYARGARAGVSMALSHATASGHLKIVEWLVASAGPDLGWKNWQDKTPLAVAIAAGHGEVADLLRSRGAPE